MRKFFNYDVTPIPLKLSHVFYFTQSTAEIGFMLFVLIKITYNSLAKCSKQKMHPALLLFSEDIVVFRIYNKIVPIERLPPVYQNRRP